MSISLGAATMAAAGIGAGSSLLSGFMNYSGSKKLMEKQYSLNKRYFDYVSNYNSPVNQMKRLDEAGLNPNLVYANGADATSSAIGSISQGSASFFKGHDFMNDLLSYQTLDRNQAQTEQIRSNIQNQKDLTAAEVNLKNKQAEQAVEMTKYYTKQVEAQTMDNAFLSYYGGQKSFDARRAAFGDIAALTYSPREKKIEPPEDPGILRAILAGMRMGFGF